MRGAPSLWPSVKQVERGQAALLHLSFSTVPIIMVFENNNLGNQKTDLHIKVRNWYKLWALNLTVHVEWTVCLVSCIWTNVSFTVMTQENSSEKKWNLCRAGPSVYLLTDFSHIYIQAHPDTIWSTGPTGTNADKPWKISVLSKPNLLPFGLFSYLHTCIGSIWQPWDNRASCYPIHSNITMLCIHWGTNKRNQ